MYISKKFSSEWWNDVAKQSLFRFNIYAWQSHYYDIYLYCNERAEIAFWNENKTYE